MEFKVLIYLVGAVVYFVFKQYQKLQKEATNRKTQLLEEMTSSSSPIVIETAKPLQRVKSERQQLDAESARLRAKNKMQVSKTPKPFFEKPEHVTSVFSNSGNIGQVSTSAAVLSTSNENFIHEEIDIRKMILYSELLKRPAW